MLTVHDIFGDDGLIARRLSHYEKRPEQLAMAEAVAKAIAEERHAVLEAGTGVGKSFAYSAAAVLRLSDNLPAAEPPQAPQAAAEVFSGDTQAIERYIMEAEAPTREESAPRHRTVISTHTIALQEQLFDKDLPFLHSVLPIEFTSVLIKGRGNYLCRRRLDKALRHSRKLFDDTSDEILQEIRRWSRRTSDGTKSDLPAFDSEAVLNTVWNEIACERGNCLGRHCPFRKDCFYQQARRRAENASLLVVNHALLFSDLMVRQGGGAILPNFDLLIFDEAHTMEQTAGEQMGLSITQGSVSYLLNRLSSERTGRGLLSVAGGDAFLEARRAVGRCRKESDVLFHDLENWLADRPGGNGRVRQPGIVSRSLPEALKRLAICLHDVCDQIDEPKDRIEYVAARAQTNALAGEIDSWIGQSCEEDVYWLETSAARRGSQISMRSAPLDVGKILRTRLFGTIPTVVMTSATLSTAGGAEVRASSQESRYVCDTDSSGGQTGDSFGFNFFRSRVGFPPDAIQARFGSPFDYEKQMTLVLVEGIPEPSASKENLSPLFVSSIKRYVQETDGGAFVLFTSNALLRKTADHLRPWFDEQGYPLYVQGEGIQRSRMIEEFRRQKRGVLFGADSFWQGVDVRGKALRNVIITRFPFPVPTLPLIEARSEAIEQRGGNPFMSYSLPQAILKFKQGFGRLIRSRDDEGLVVVLDPRIRTKYYGRRFIEALPRCRVRTDTAAR
ncbi:MAG: helicase [Thermoguttaceae bacterium]|nr:helicase [Thermoguttaceae bacterium]